jgi:integration host factor subunit beta
MVKSELVLRLAARFKHLVQQDAEIAVNLIVGAMIDALAHGRRVEIREFGSFTLRERKARKARNPRTGESVNVPAKARIYFRPTGDLKRRVSCSISATPKQKKLPTPRMIEQTQGRSKRAMVRSQEAINLLETSG